MSRREWYDIQARGNRSAEVFVYGDIGESWSEETITAKKFVAEIGALAVDVLRVRINSIGGSVPDGLAIFNALKRHKASVTVSIDGLAASVASLIAMAGNTVEMAENAMIMIHAPWSVVVGNAEEMRDRAELLDKMAQAMATSYVRPGGLTHDAALALLTDGEDHWYTADEAKGAGIVDAVTEAVQMAASLDISRFKAIRTPAAAAAPTQKGKTMAEQQVTTPAAPNPPAAPIQAALHAPEPEALTIDLDEIKAEALKDDNTRRLQIEAIAKPWLERADVRAAVKQAQDGMKSVETFRAEFLRMLGRNSQSLGGGLIMTVEDEDDKFRAGVTAGLMIRAGLVPNDRTNEFRGYSLMELCRASLQRKNIPTKGMDKMQVVAAGFTHSTSDFDNLLADVANKSMQKGYEESEETFQRWTSVGTLPDFKASKRVDLNTFPALGKVEPGAEYRYVTVGDRGETIQLATYGSLFSINRQAIINDDLGAFTRVPNKMGRAAIRTVGNLVYAVLTGNPNMADGTALFHANHANLLTGAVISTTSVDLMDAAMAKQTDVTGNTLNVTLAYLVVPRALKGLAMQVANAEFEVSGSKNLTIPNWMRGNFEVVADARLDATSASNWFGAANPNINDTIEVAYLDGNTTPQLEQQGGWTVDGVDFKVRIDAAVKALDWRGLAKNPN